MVILICITTIWKVLDEQKNKGEKKESDMTDAHQIHVPVVLETSFDKIITYQGRGMEIRRVY